MTDELQLRRYLLGTLEEAARAAVEARLFADDEFFRLAEAMESELMDLYVAGELRAEEKAAWEAYMTAHPRTRQRLALARELDRKFSGNRRAVLWLGVWAAAAVLLVCVWVLRPREAAVPRPMVFAVALTAGGVRTAEAKPQIVRIPPGTQQVRFTWKGAAGMERVAIRQIDTGRVVWTDAAEAGVPVALLSPGDYVATGMDRAGEELADFVFRVATGGE